MKSGRIGRVTAQVYYENDLCAWIVLSLYPQISVVAVEGKCAVVMMMTEVLFAFCSFVRRFGERERETPNLMGLKESI